MASRASSRYSYIEGTRSRRKAGYSSGSRYSRASTVAVARSRARVPGIMNMEFKSIDILNSLAAADTTGTIGLLNGVTLGSDINNRIGRQVELRSIQLRVQSFSTFNTGIDQWNRALIVYDRQSNGASPAITDVLTAATINAVRNLNNRKRFKILMDKTVYLNAAGETDSGTFYDFYRKLRHPVEFNAGNAGIVSDIQSGAIYLIAIGSATAGNTAGNILFSSRIRFTDV